MHTGSLVCAPVCVDGIGMSEERGSPQATVTADLTHTSIKADPCSGTSLKNGAIAGLTSALCLQPLDVLKTRLQERQSGRNRGGPVRMVQVCKEIMTKGQGVFNFWRGTTPTLLRNVPGVALYFVTLQHLQYLLFLGHQRRLAWIEMLYNATGITVLGNMAVGALARTIAGGLLMPATVLKVRYESSLYRGYTSLSQSLRQLLATDGLIGLFRGFWATTLRDAPNAAIYLSIYRTLQNVLPGTNHETLSTLVCAGTAAGTATLVTHPFDLLKTRLQLSSQSQNIFRLFVNILKVEGLRSFFAGIAPRLVRKSLSSAITWAVYERLSK